MGRSALMAMPRHDYPTNKRWEAFHGEKDAFYYLHGGKMGLTNLGNTCFMNAGIQCLAHIEPIAAYFLTGKYHEELNTDNPLGCAGKLGTTFAALLKSMWQPSSSSSSRAIEPRKMHDALVRFAPHLMENKEQQDVQEFLAYMLDGLSEDLNLVKERPEPLSMTEEEEEKMYSDLEREHGEEVLAATRWKQYLMRNKSFLVDICQGQLRSVLTCTECGYTSKTFDPYLYLSLPVSASTTTVSEALHSFLQEEELEEDNRWRCGRCKTKVVARKKIDIYKAPSVLILHLKRFSFDHETGATAKVGNQLDAPLTMDLSEFIVSEHKDSLTYDIIGVANHTGELGKGHYTATCKHHIDSEYYHFDDTGSKKVESVDEIITSEAYVLFLLRRAKQSGALRRQTITLPDVWPHWVFLKDSKIVPMTIAERSVLKEMDEEDDETSSARPSDVQLCSPNASPVKKSESKFFRSFKLQRMRSRGKSSSALSFGMGMKASEQPSAQYTKSYPLRSSMLCGPPRKLKRTRSTSKYDRGQSTDSEVLLTEPAEENPMDADKTPSSVNQPTAAGSTVSSPSEEDPESPTQPVAKSTCTLDIPDANEWRIVDVEAQA